MASAAVPEEDFQADFQAAEADSEGAVLRVAGESGALQIIRKLTFLYQYYSSKKIYFYFC